MIAGIKDIPGIKEVRGGTVLLWSKISKALNILTPTEGQEFAAGETVTITFEIVGYGDINILTPTEGQEFAAGETVTITFEQN